MGGLFSFPVHTTVDALSASSPVYAASRRAAAW
jgi:hypothetical protein